MGGLPSSGAPNSVLGVEGQVSAVKLKTEQEEVPVTAQHILKGVGAPGFQLVDFHPGDGWIQLFSLPL